MRRSVIPWLLFLGLICSPPAAVSGEPAGTLERYRKALSRSPEDPALHYALGVALLEQDRNAEALDSLLHAYPAYVDSIEANFNLALVHVRLSRRSDALVFLAQAEELGAAKQSELYPLGDLYFILAIEALNARDLRESAYLFERSLFVNPLRADACRLLGRVYEAQGRTEKALEQFERYLGLHPGDPDVLGLMNQALLGRASRLLESEKFDEAKADLESVLQREPSNPFALYYLAYLDYLRGNREQALEALLFLDASAPAELIRAARELLDSCARRWFNEGEYSSARRALEALLQTERPDASHLFLAGNLAQAQDRTEEAARYYRQVLAVQPGHPDARNNLILLEQPGEENLLALADEALAQGRYSEALSALERARMSSRERDFRIPERIATLRRRMDQLSQEAFSQADSRLARGELFLALDEVDRGLELRPDSPWGQDLLQETRTRLSRQRSNLLLRCKRHLAMGEAQEAAEIYGRLVQLDPRDGEAEEGLLLARALLNNTDPAAGEERALRSDEQP